MSNNKITIYNLNETITIPETGANALHYWASIDDIESKSSLTNLSDICLCIASAHCLFLATDSSSAELL